MATTFTLLASSTVGAGGAASITFSSIPSTYTDIKVLYSAMGNATEGIYVQFNGSTANFTGRYLYGDGANAISGVLARYLGSINGATNTPGNGELYIPNYTGSNNKSFSVDEVAENNGATAFQNIIAGLWSNSAAITSITLEAASSFKANSTFYLYGIKNS